MKKITNICFKVENFMKFGLHASKKDGCYLQINYLLMRKWAYFSRPTNDKMGCHGAENSPCVNETQKLNNEKENNQHMK